MKRSSSCKIGRRPAGTLTPLMEDPDVDSVLGADDNHHRNVEVTLLRARGGKGNYSKNRKKLLGAWKSFSVCTAASKSRPDLIRVLLGVLGCPLAPVPLLLDHSSASSNHHHPLRDLQGISIGASSAYYIIHQYLAATGCLKHDKIFKNMYASGTVKMVCHETEIGIDKGRRSGSRIGARVTGCFVIWQMNPGMWSMELVIQGGDKVVAGSNGKIVWRNTPWLGTHAAKGPPRPLRRIIQGLDPKSTANLFSKAECLGEKRIGNEDCFILRVTSHRDDVMERSNGSRGEVIRHVLYGYFSQKSGLLIHMEDSHLTKVLSVKTSSSITLVGNTDYDADNDDAEGIVYWETTVGTSMRDYRDVDGLLIAHQGTSVATLFRFGESSSTMIRNSRTRMEEVWKIDDIMFNVPGLSLDYFIPPSNIRDAANNSF
ncbi:hypothetical protein MKX01_036953 [Papaver californicum]|nr:hypothetical protein MKX01_036953 [Papaver californicum]